MANTEVDFCGLRFKNPMVIASLETTNSPDLTRQCFDAGAAGAIVKTLTDIEDMAQLTQNSKYCIMNDQGEIIKGKVPRSFTFYSRSGYASIGRPWARYHPVTCVYRIPTPATVRTTLITVPTNGRLMATNTTPNPTSNVTNSRRSSRPIRTSPATPSR